MSQHSSAQFDSDSFARAAAGATWPPDLENDPSHAGQCVGNYQLLEQLGAGGMGTVYRAEQLRPVQRTVAIKFIKLGIHTSQVHARFVAERQSLAVLEHPGIARVYDAGTTGPDSGLPGRPYFVMEYVPGRAITEFCDARRLTTSQRLALFEQVCQAVQHAHFKGILHRDLKPSNILVAELDGRAQVKIIDFGVAKVISESGSSPYATDPGQFVGTPIYSSPEQTAGEDVDTRADVYSLGAVLYELLSGAPPFDPGRHRSASFREAKSSDPPRPSLRLTERKVECQTVSSLRGVDAPMLLRQLRGDLDRIVMQAMHHDRTQRYETAAALGEDIRRHLSHLPILARPPTLAYQARKFARRNRVLVAAVALVASAIIAGGTMATVGLVRARTALAREARARQAEQAQRQVAENVSAFLGDMLASADPRRAKGEKVLVRDVLDRVAPQLDARFASQPLIAASLHTIIAETYNALGLLEEARAHAQSAMDLHRAAQGSDHPESLEAQVNLAGMLRSLKRFGDAEPLLRDALQRQRRLAGSEHALTVAAEESLALVLCDTGRAHDAEPLARHAMQANRRRFGPDHAHALISMTNLAAVLDELDRTDEAEALYRSVAETRQRTLGSDHPSTLLAWGNLTAAMMRQKRFADAERILREVLPRSESVLGFDHPQTLQCINNLASALSLQLKMDEAEAMFRELVARAKTGLPEAHLDRLLAIAYLAELLEQRGKREEAIAAYKELFDRAAAKSLLPTHAAMLSVPYGARLAKYGQYNRAEAPLLEAKRRLEVAEMSGSSKMRIVLEALADVCEHTSRPAKAARWREQLKAMGAAKITTSPQPPAAAAQSSR